MFNADDIIKNVEKLMNFEIQTGGETQRAVQQHIGKIINHEDSMNYGTLYYDMFHRLDRILKGEKAEHWEGQNKKSNLEKIQDKVIKNNLGDGW